MKTNCVTPTLTRSSVSVSLSPLPSFYTHPVFSTILREMFEQIELYF